MAEMSRKATVEQSNWIGVMLGAQLGAVAGVLLGLIAWWTEAAEQQAQSMMLLSSPWAVATWGVFLRRVQSAKECPGWPQTMQGQDECNLLSEATAWTAALI